MGYIASYTLSFQSDEETRETIREWLLERLDFLDDIPDGESFKWDSMHDDMEELSRLHPSVHFTVTGYGEERDNIWRAHFRNGRSAHVKAIISFPEPSEE
jgi:hypothetical protein